MAKQKRITVNAIKSAYKKTGLKPTVCSWFNHGEACPIGAIAMANGVVTKKDSLTRRENKAYQWAMDKYGSDYVERFLEAYDEKKAGFQSPGGQDGFMARLAVYDKVEEGN